MKATRWWVLVALAAGSFAVSWVILTLARSRALSLLPVTWTVVVALLVVAAGVLWAGLTVRAYQAGKKPNLSGLRAAQLILVGKTASHGGALLAGWYAAEALVVVGQLAIEPERARFIVALCATAAAVVVMIAGLLVEHWGKVPPADDAETTDHGKLPGNEAIDGA